MKRSETIEDYKRRIEAVIGYIDRHLDEDLELGRLARVANFSPYHFHRIFRAFRGEPLGTYITRRRVEAAGRLLRGSALPVETIAYNVGFGTPSSLSKAFQRFYDVTPSEYRSDKTIHIMKTPKINRPVRLQAPRIVEREPRTALYIPFTGEYKRIDYAGAFARLWKQAENQGLLSPEAEYLSVFYNDPKTTEPADLRTDVCLTVAGAARGEGDVAVRTISGGRYAVFLHIGPYDEVGAVYDAIFGEWVPENCTCGDECGCGDDCRCVLRDESVFEKYVNDPDSVAPAELRTEIYVPIE